MRVNLIEARKQKGFTQQEMAEKLGISERQYQRIESGKTNSTFQIWDSLEDMFQIHQRILREDISIFPTDNPQ